MTINVKDDRGYNQGFKLNFATEIRMHRRAQFMINNMDNSQTKTVLEIGCGRGEIAYWVAEQTPHNVIGSDLCVPFIEQAKKTYIKPNLQYEVIDFNNNSHLQNRTFDYIIGNGILHHLYDNLNPSLNTLHQILKPNGKIIFIEPNIYNPYIAAIFKIKILRKIANLEPQEMAFSGSFIKQQLQLAGFKTSAASYKDFLLPGVPKWSVKVLIAIGNVIEKIPVLNRLAQSVFIVAQK
jgi:2-polyprenyl-3-methyl-5-hydroxy-6-metoxy-1,4-benzoquinol methylase